MEQKWKTNPEKNSEKDPKKKPPKKYGFFFLHGRSLCHQLQN